MATVGAAASVLIIGAGNMGGALARGLNAGQPRPNAAAKTSADVSLPASFTVSLHDIHGERLATLAEATGARAVTGVTAADLKGLAALILCVKPQDLATIASQLRGKLESGTLVVSILAGVTMADVGQALGHAGAVVRAMPNIAATVGAAATAMCENGHCNPQQTALAEAIFGAIGEADWTREGLLDAVTGLSGSGPAYLYMVIEALTDGGVKMGIPRVLAAKLATQTVLGSAMLVQATGLHPAILRDQVTTPGGTTITAIHELESRGLRAMLISAVETATNRAAHLRKT